MTEPISFVILFAIGTLVAAWLATHFIDLSKRDRQVQTMPKPFRISLPIYILIVAILSLFIFTLDGMAFILLLVIVLPATVIDLIIIALINRRYLRLIGEVGGMPEKIKIISGLYTLLYWLSIMVFSVFSATALLNVILQNSASLQTSYQAAGYPQWVLFASMPVLALMYHGIISSIRKAFG